MQNQGLIDRLLRVMAGMALLSLVFLDPPVMSGWLGLALLMTGIAGVCPLYQLTGFSTVRS